MFEKVDKEPLKYKTPPREGPIKGNIADSSPRIEYPVDSPWAADEVVDASIWGEYESEKIKRQKPLGGKD